MIYFFLKKIWKIGGGGPNQLLMDIHIVALGALLRESG